MGSRAAQLCAVVLLLQLILSGCLSLVIREDDDAVVVTGKVATRTLIAIPTLGISELQIAEVKEVEESRPVIVTSGSHNPRAMAISSVNKPKTVVVWGNHPAAVSHAVDLIQSKGGIVVERARLQSVFDEQKIRLSTPLMIWLTF